MSISSTSSAVSLPPKVNLSSQVHNYDRASLPSTYSWTREYADGRVVASDPVYLDEPVRRHSVFERALHTVVEKMRSRSALEKTASETVKCRQWQEDLRTVYDGTCLFLVQYLGSKPAKASKGIKICENVIKALKRQENRTAKKKDENFHLTGSHCCTMYISADSIVVVEDETQNVLVEDIISNISYCAAHRSHEKYFAYISRNPTRDRTWSCHVFITINDTGERLSHAVGCAFEACHSKQNEANTSNMELTNRTTVSVDPAAGTQNTESSKTGESTSKFF